MLEPTPLPSPALMTVTPAGVVTTVDEPMLIVVAAATGTTAGAASPDSFVKMIVDGASTAAPIGAANWLGRIPMRSAGIRESSGIASTPTSAASHTR